MVVGAIINTFAINDVKGNRLFAGRRFWFSIVLFLILKLKDDCTIPDGDNGKLLFINGFYNNDDEIDIFIRHIAVILNQG